MAVSVGLLPDRMSAGRARPAPRCPERFGLRDDLRDVDDLEDVGDNGAAVGILTVLLPLDDLRFADPDTFGYIFTMGPRCLRYTLLADAVVYRTTVWRLLTTPPYLVP